jgi:hypothetical protein
MNLPLDIVRRFSEAVENDPTKPLVSGQFSGLERQLNNLGMSLENMVYFVNNATEWFGPDPENGTAIHDVILLNGVVCLDVILRVSHGHTGSQPVVDLR